MLEDCLTPFVLILLFGWIVWLVLGQAPYDRHQESSEVYKALVVDHEMRHNE
jgi:hypothetical protein